MKKLLALLFLICCFSATVKSKTTKNVHDLTTNSEIITSINNESLTLDTALFEAPTKNTGDEDLRRKFRIGFDAPQIDHRQLLLTMDENTTDGYDWGYDAEIYELFNDDMYWLIDQKKYVIQATNDIVIGKEIPLGIVTVEGGTISIGVDALENPIDGIRVCILDKELNIIRDIQESVYQITLPAGEYHNRFAITFVSIDTNLDEINAENIPEADITNNELPYGDNTSSDTIIDQQFLMYVNNISDSPLP